jgi:3-oxoacyl-[acyl-carrier protein] reductase
MRKLAGKAAIVTGASKGIGKAIAKRMAEEGAAVLVNYASGASDAERVVLDIAAHGGKAVAAQADVTKKAEVERMFAAAGDAFGRLDILVNNAGVYAPSPLDRITEEHFHRHFNLNVLGLIFCSQAAAMRFGPEGGCIVNISSLAAMVAPAGVAVYSASKAAVDALTRSLAEELGPRRIRVNSINPGMVDTEGWRAAGIHESELRRQVERQTPLGRVGKPADVAGAAVFLASADAAWITGETLVISGGYR